MRNQGIEELQSHYQSEGYAVVQNFLSPEEVAQLRASMIQFAKLYPEFCVPEAREDGEAGKLLFQALNFADKVGFVKSLLGSTKLQGYLQHFLGEPASLFIEDFHYKEPGGGAYDPHQDMQSPVLEWVNQEYKPTIPVDKLVTVVLAVDDHTRENGCMQVAPRVHHRGLLGPEGGNLAKEFAATLEFKDVEMKAGDALFFDGYCPHGSQVNRSASSRKGLFLFYNPSRCGDQRLWAQDYFLHDKLV